MYPGRGTRHVGVMTILTESISPSTDHVRPGVARRTALAVTGFLACALPTVWTVNLTRFLVTGELSEHRFHQLTGQGLLLTTLWLGALVPLLVAGWSGRRPSSAAGALHLLFAGSGAVCAAAATGGGAPALVVVIVLTGGLLWLALPARPRLRLPVRVDPLLMPVALVTAAVSTPYVLDQVALQNAATGHHAQNPHFFDMAWLVSTLVLAAVVAAAVPAVRRLGLVAGAGLAWTGLMGILLAADTPFTPVALGAGVAILLASGRR